MVDELDFPSEALREAVSNALIHRSLSTTSESTTIAIRVTPATVEITSPGGVHPGVDPNQLGLSPLSTPRNDALVRMCGQLTSPHGIRLSKPKHPGLQERTVPAGTPGQRRCFSRLVQRDFRQLPCVVVSTSVKSRIGGPAPEPTPTGRRLVAFLERREAVQQQDVSTVFFNTPLDAVLAARLLTPNLIEHVVPILGGLVGTRVLREVPRYDRVAWALAERLDEQPPVTTAMAPTRPRRTDSVQVLLEALAADRLGELQPRDIDLGLSPRGKRRVSSRPRGRPHRIDDGKPP